MSKLRKIVRNYGLGNTHLVIPDPQAKPGVQLDHFTWLGRWAAEHCPDKTILLGDTWDFPSLSGHDSDVSKAKHNRSKQSDIDAGNKALELFENELTKRGVKLPCKYLLEGNHDGLSYGGRVYRHLQEHPDDSDFFTPDKFADSWLGWERIPFLQILNVDGVSYSHLFPFTSRGTVSANSMRMGAANALTQVKIMMRSCTAGHKQGLDSQLYHSYDRTLRGIIAGSFYQHDEAYMGPGNNHWRGVLIKHNVSLQNVNHYDLLEMSLPALKHKYGK